MGDVGDQLTAYDGGDSELLAVLEMIRDRGAIGESSLPRAVLHSSVFADLLPAGAATVDLGSGGGLPGLVIAVRRPDVRLTLVERRATRADLLRRGVAALDVGGRVEVVVDDVRELARAGRTFDAVTARSFAAPLELARLAAPLCRPGGLALVSEPPSDEPDDPARWPAARLASLGWVDAGRQRGIRQLRRIG